MAAHEANDFMAAALAFDRAVALRPSSTVALYNRGLARLMLGDHERARPDLLAALAGSPSIVEANHTLAQLADHSGDYERAEAGYRAVATMGQQVQRISRVAARRDLGMLLLRLGRWREGWSEFERRLECPEAANQPVCQAAQVWPRWRGRPLAGRLLVVGNEGLGDAIQFARWLPAAAARCQRLTLACHPALEPLFGSVAGADAVVSDCRLEPADHDAFVPITSLGAALDATPHDPPIHHPYIAVPDRQAPLRPPGRLAVGLCWAGNPSHTGDWRRSLPAGVLAPLLSVPGASFVSVQVGDAARAQLATALPGVPDWGASFRDLADTAAALAQLDLVIACDTSVLHLAGAVGATAWGLLATVSDWRWGTGGETVPWYPSMRLFRQERPGDWAGVIAKARDALGIQVEACSRQPFHRVAILQ